MRINVEVMDVKLAAAGRWREILASVAGIDGELLDGKHHPCPMCGGTDRFRAFNDVAATGGVICNQCHSRGNGDGLSTVQWACGVGFREALEKIANHLGLGGDVVARSAMAAYCAAKLIPEAALRKYGAIEHSDGTISVPMYGPDGRVCSDCTLSLRSDRESKGVNASGRPAGLFWTDRPKPGEKIALVEGVKDAAALDSLGIRAVGLPTSSLSAKFAPLFAECHVVLVPDRDKGGEEGAARSAAVLAGHAASVVKAILPGRLRDSGGDGVREAIESSGAEVVASVIATAKPIGSTGVRITRLTDASLEYLQRVREGDVGIVGSGFADLDGAMGGYAAGELVVVGARPSHGKSAFALQWLLCAADNDLPGMFVSQEMGALAIAKRSLQNQADMTAGDLKRRTREAEQIVAQQRDEQSPIYITEGCADVVQICDQVERAVERDGVRVVAIDYVQLIRGDGKSRYEQVSFVSQQLRTLATSTGTTIMALAQLSREVDKRPDHEPMLADFRDSGQIEQDADVAIGLVWPWRYDDRREVNEYRLKVLKNRNREIRQMYVAVDWRPDVQRFQDKATEFVPEFDTEFAP